MKKIIKGFFGIFYLAGQEGGRTIKGMIQDFREMKNTSYELFDEIRVLSKKCRELKKLFISAYK